MTTHRARILVQPRGSDQFGEPGDSVLVDVPMLQAWLMSEVLGLKLWISVLFSACSLVLLPR